MTLLKLQLSCLLSRSWILAEQATSVEFITHLCNCHDLSQNCQFVVQMSKCNVWSALEALHRKLLKLISPKKSSFTLSSKEIAMLYSVHLGIFTIMSNHLVSSFFSPEILKKNEVWSCNHDTKASQNCPKGFTRYLKFILSEKATKFCEISTIDFSFVFN